MENILDSFVEELKNTLGANLKSVILYGSQASGEAVKKYSDYNLLLILEKLDFPVLKDLCQPVNKWMKKNNPAPVMFKENRFNKSFDVFPIEFLDIQEHHKLLHGTNPFVNMKIDLGNLRHECEHELKGKYLKLRQEYIAVKGKPSRLKPLLISSISTFLVLFRTVIRLSGQNPPAKKLDALNMLASQAKINIEPFITVSSLKEGVKEAQKADMEALFSAYLNEIEKVIDFVDGYVVK